ncbi:hypothetical protein SLS62_007356 [Diatrype stigma]|uniref:N-acetyltransferase domain-containing protein n=1 Tax=Diatrype stigma TaxID=117547 RepID=A0AAN9UMR7_9PEZI
MSTSATKTKPFDPFRSARLVYRAVEDTTEDELFVHSIQRDAEAQSGSSYGLLAPESRKASNKFKEHVAEKCIVGALVCLPPPTDLGAPGKQELLPLAGTPVGIVCLKASPPHFAHHRNSDISIDVAREYRGQGYGAEAIAWVLWYGFQMAGLHRIQIMAFSFNDGAMRLYERMGFEEEGRQRDFMWFNGGWHDNVIYGMLEHEWRKLSNGSHKVWFKRG